LDGAIRGAYREGLWPPGQGFVMPSATESVQQHCAMQRQWNMPDE
jgi:hypothetical protein